jgi:pyruvate,water dikinase
VTADLVRPLAGVRAGDRATVGGKAASLGELSAAGIRVPPGFVVLTAAFDRVVTGLEHDRALGDISQLPVGDHAAIARVTGPVRARITSKPLPDDVRTAIVEQYRGLGDAVPVAVRSSATSEDSADTSFAGLQDTYLWVRGEDALLSHVRSCWASLYSVESVAYRRRLRLAEHGLAMAVVVQQMVDAQVAGVMFTCSPVTGDRSVVALEATWGLGSALVSGDVTPDTYVVSKVTGEIVERTVATKLRLHRMDPSGAGVRSEDVPPDQQRQPCLRDEQIRALARMGRQVEDHYGSPQDIEWAIDAGTVISLLQSRPETVWSRRQPSPVATPKSRPFDHVFDLLSGGRAASRSESEGHEPGAEGTST